MAVARARIHGLCSQDRPTEDQVMYKTLGGITAAFMLVTMAVPGTAAAQRQESGIQKQAVGEEFSAQRRRVSRRASPATAAPHIQLRGRAAGAIHIQDADIGGPRPTPILTMPAMAAPHTRQPSKQPRARGDRAS